MTDTVSAKKRSEVMSRVGSKDTKPELLIRKGLHARGFRYRLHVKDLPGKPDMVFPRYDSVIQVNGCFWHGHDCPRCRMPSSNTEYWNKKVARNMERDASNRRSLRDQGWRVLTIWECALTGKWKLELSQVIDLAAAWLLSTNSIFEIKGKVFHPENRD
ncbi:MAG: very short patch repair endonuclease [Chloroflexi bacterium]|nr:very short patch repair endonuclease [Chloroflexota bacterium]